MMPARTTVIFSKENRRGIDYVMNLETEEIPLPGYSLKRIEGFEGEEEVDED